MIAINPITISSSNLTTSNVAEADQPAWSAATTYALGALVMVASVHNIYKSVAAGNLNHDPTLEVQGDPANPPVYWLLVGTTNRYNMFDGYSYTQTTNANSIQVTIDIASRFTSLALLNIEATQVTVLVVNATYGTVYNKTFDMLNYAGEPSFFSYFFDEPGYTSDLAILDLPNYYSNTITVTISNPSATAKCGAFLLGEKYDLGLSQYGLSVDLKDYSSLLRNFDGTYSLTKRQSAKGMDVDFIVDKSASPVVLKKLAVYLGSPVLFLGADDRPDTYVYGILTKARKAISYPTQDLYSISVDGFI